MGRLLKTRRTGWAFLGVMGLLLVLAAGMAMLRIVPLKMLPYGNKSDLQLVLDFDKGTTLERSDSAVGEIERYLAGVPEVTDFTSYVGVAPLDNDQYLVSWYSSDVQADPNWLEGMFSPSDIWLAWLDFAKP